MKRQFLTTLCTAVFVLSVSFAARATIEGSKHDFTFAANECEVCHTPHKAFMAAAPLWRHHDPALDLQVYDQYVSVDVRGTMQATVGQPNGISKLCLNCHNGITGPSGMTQVLGTDLKNDHPISFTYDAALATADGYLYDPTTRPSGITGSSGTIADDMLRGPGNDQLECVSCHEVHNKYEWAKMLRVQGAVGTGPGYTSTPQVLCKTCHALGVGGYHP